MVTGATDTLQKKCFYAIFVNW